MPLININARRALLLALLAIFLPGVAAAQLVDQVYAIVDDEIILKSDVDAQYYYLIKSGEVDDGTLYCQVFDEIIRQKLLLTKAQLDSLEVSEDQIDEEIARRLDYMMQQMGGQAELEKAYQQSIFQIRQDLRPELREQQLIDQQRSIVQGEITVTPQEVREFFNQIPKDSLPYLPAEVEVSHIVMAPTASAASVQAARNKLQGIRNDIASGEMRFEEMAMAYSQDGAASNGGFLGEFGRGMMDPTFEEMVYSLEEGQLSPVFETSFGVHIAKLNRRNGDRVEASHIIIIPQVSAADEQRCKDSLNFVRNLIETDSLTFAEAAEKYSIDPNTSIAGGVITTRSGGFRIPLDQLDADLYLLIDQLETGEISQPVEYIQPRTNTKYFRLVQLRSRTRPHRASLEEDYEKFKTAALQAKRAEAMANWFERAKKNVYVEVKDCDECPCTQALQHWNTRSN